MDYGNAIERNVDIVFCIDGTGSMGPCIDEIKNNVRKFQTDFEEALEGAKSSVKSLRVKLITFRDYLDDGDNAMVVTDFFELPDDQDRYEAALNSIAADGGGDIPENGLEAIYLAMKSDFYTGPKDRQVIVLFSDADALDLKERASCPNYPADMVDMKGFQEAWACVQGSGLKLRSRQKRLCVFAPAGTKYEQLTTELDQTWFKPVEMGEGLRDIDFSDIIRMLVNSVAAH